MTASHNWPASVLAAAHAAYPAAVGRAGLYGLAFFGHARPAGLPHRATTESVWRGCCRAALRAYCLHLDWADTRAWLLDRADYDYQRTGSGYEAVRGNWAADLFAQVDRLTAWPPSCASIARRAFPDWLAQLEG